MIVWLFVQSCVSGSHSLTQLDYRDHSRSLICEARPLEPCCSLSETFEYAEKMEQTKTITAVTIFAFTLTGCGGGEAVSYDQPDEAQVKIALNAYHEAVRQSHGPDLNAEEFEKAAKAQACDRLPEKPTMPDYQDLAATLSLEEDIHYDAAFTLVLGGTIWCQDKILWVME